MLHGYHIPLNWFITDLDCNQYPNNKWRKEPLVITGEELNETISKNQFQVNWGVFSGIREPLERIDTTCMPYADGNAELWQSKYQIQHPQAECELISWDSTATFFHSKNPKAMSIFKRHFKEATEVNEVNENTGK